MVWGGPSLEAVDEVETIATSDVRPIRRLRLTSRRRRDGPAAYRARNARPRRQNLGPSIHCAAHRNRSRRPALVDRAATGSMSDAPRPSDPRADSRNQDQAPPRSPLQ